MGTATSNHAVHSSLNRNTSKSDTSPHRERFKTANDHQQIDDTGMNPVNTANDSPMNLFSTTTDLDTTEADQAPAAQTTTSITKTRQQT
jgi:hypothetical protein